MADNPVQFRVDTTEWNAALKELQRVTGTSFRTIFKGECKTVVRKLLKNEWRASPKNIEDQLRQRIVIFGPGIALNIPRGERSNIPKRLPNGFSRYLRARSGRRGKWTGQSNPGKPGKLIKDTRSEVSAYKRRMGFLASGWGAAGRVLGIQMPDYITRHNLNKTGWAFADFNRSGGPIMKIVNKANPGRGSRDKLNTTLRIQAGAIKRSINAGIDRAFARIQP